MTGGGSKVRCCKEQYCLGTWNVRSMNQGKLEVVKQEMGRVNIDILGISKLRWTRMGDLNSDDHYIYYCGQESLRSNKVPSQSAKTRPGADCGSDHELLIAKFILKLNKVEKTTRPFRYDLNQIPYDYTVEVRTTFKGLDLIECLMNYLDGGS